MGCGRTNLSGGNKVQIQKRGFIEHKLEYEQALQAYRSFVEKNPSFESEVSSISPDKINNFMANKEALFKANSITRKSVLKGIYYNLNQKDISKCIIKLNAYHKFIEIIDKINQTDTDIKILKEITSTASNGFFHKPSNNNTCSVVIDFNSINDDDLGLALLEQIKYELSTKINHLTIIIPVDSINKGHFFIELSDLIENSINLLSISVVVANKNYNTNKTPKYKEVILNSLFPVTSAIRTNTSIRNIAFGCDNCKGLMSIDMQNEIIYMLSENLFSLGLMNLELADEVFFDFVDRLFELKHLKLLLYEPPNEYDLQNKDIILDRLCKKLHDTDTLEFAYFTGMDDCSEDLITSSINLLRKNGIVKSVIIDKPFGDALSKYFN